jgi:hypothetical protein
MGYAVWVAFVFVAVTFTVALFLQFAGFQTYDYILLLCCSISPFTFHASRFTLSRFFSRFTYVWGT